MANYKHPLVGYAFVVVLMTTLIYVLLLHTRDELVADCQRTNLTRAQVNDRVKPLHALASIQIKARLGSDAIPRSNRTDNKQEVRRLRHVRRQVRPVALADCAASFDRPWPL